MNWIGVLIGFLIIPYALSALILPIWLNDVLHIKQHDVVPGLFLFIGLAVVAAVGFFMWSER